jgi:hypothetical protein
MAKPKRFDVVVIGTGSVMETVELVLRDNPKLRVAVIDKDTPGGICLTVGVYLRRFFCTR